MEEQQFFWKKDLEKSINIMPDGNNRIQVITINSSPLKTCLVNVYMPSLQVAGDLDYKDTLDQISEIIEKYKDSYQTIICGDMNASLHRDNRRRDQNFKEFMSNNNLSLANRYPKAPTFFHHNGNSGLKNLNKMIVGIDECASQPCQNNGTCIDQHNGYTCICLRGDSGYNCEI
ncbi:Hypothetical predicted protein, partial [Mytilus galloprovincialis]